MKIRLYALLPTERKWSAAYLRRHRGRPYPGRRCVLGVQAFEEYTARFGRWLDLLFWVSHPMTWLKCRFSCSDQ